MTQPWSDLERLGQVAPPPPAVLDAAREILWAAVASVMLTSENPGRTAEPRRITPREQQAPRRLPPDPGA